MPDQTLEAVFCIPTLQVLLVQYGRLPPCPNNGDSFHLRGAFVDAETLHTRPQRARYKL